MAKIRYPIGPAECPFCGKEFNRNKALRVFCSPRCRLASHLAKPLLDQMKRITHELDKAKAEVESLRKENLALKAKLMGAGYRFTYDGEDQSLA